MPKASWSFGNVSSNLDLYELLRARRMCRAYEDRAVPSEVLVRVLEAARRCPSAGHSQGVRFGVVENAATRQAIASELGEEAYVAKGFTPWFSRAPVHLFVATEPQAYEQRYSEWDKSSGPDTWPVDYAILDGGKALMTLYLAAHREGLACGYLGPHKAHPARRWVPWPEGWSLLGLVTLGYPDFSVNRPSRSHQRGWRDFDSVVKWWDGPE